MTTFAIRREDLSKRGEMRVALSPSEVSKLTKGHHSLLVQPAHHPETGTRKRAYADETYAAAGAKIQEDISAARVIFGLKEIDPQFLEDDKAYLFFSHTHKGQIKNREMLRTLVDRRATLIDYELITDKLGRRLITAFTFFAGYAGMIDSLWALGQKWDREKITSPFVDFKQSVDYPNQKAARKHLKDIGAHIRKYGTPADQPPLIIAVLGKGKTSAGAQEILDLLPIEEIKPGDVAQTYALGDRRKVYKTVLGIADMFRLKSDSAYEAPTRKELRKLYKKFPEQFESNLATVFPYLTVLMNCIIWAPRFPRLITRESMEKWYAATPQLRVIGDITCDPEGSIEFSRETWSDDPVFTYDPARRSSETGFQKDGVAVMAVTNLPTEFPIDASAQFSSDLAPLLPSLRDADWRAENLSDSGLRGALRRACILWRGEFTAEYAHMEKFLETSSTS